MASLGFADTELALRMFFEGRLGDDVAKPKHRDGRIVEFVSSGRRRLEHVTPEDILAALTHVRNNNEQSYFLLLDRYKFDQSVESIVESRLLPEEQVISLIGFGLKTIALYAVYPNGLEEKAYGTV